MQLNSRLGQPNSSQLRHKDRVSPGTREESFSSYPSARQVRDRLAVAGVDRWSSNLYRGAFSGSKVGLPLGRFVKVNAYVHTPVIQVFINA